METPKQESSEPEQASGRIGGELRRLKSDGAATAAELREFVGQMRGRSSQEVLGMVAESGLARSVLLATFGFAVLLIVFSAIPYYFGDRDAEASGPVAAEGADGAEDATQGGSPSAAQTATQPAADTAGPSSDTEPNGDEVIDALGIGETKTVDPDKNPLEDSLDNLLDNID